MLQPGFQRHICPWKARKSTSGSSTHKQIKQSFAAVDEPLTGPGPVEALLGLDVHLDALLDGVAQAEQHGAGHGVGEEEVLGEGTAKARA